VLVGGLDDGNPLVVPVLRLLPDGALDPFFGQGGRAEIGLLGHENYGIDALDVAPGGAIVGAGKVTRDIGCSCMLAFRLTPSGKPDEGFGAPAGSGAEGPGFVTFSGGDLSPSPGSSGCEQDDVAHVRANADGSIDVLGSTRNYELSVNEHLDAFWARLKPDGLLDVAFGTAGFALFDTGASVGSPGIGNIATHVIRTEAGGFFINDAARYPPGWYWGAAKLTPEATLDPAFGTQGVVRHQTPPAPQGSLTPLFIRDVVPLPDGSVLGVGRAYVKGRPYYLSEGEVALVQRMLSDGSRDMSFGNEGLLSFDLGFAEIEPSGASLQPDGSVMVQALVKDVGPYHFKYSTGLVRVLPPVATATSNSPLAGRADARRPQRAGRSSARVAI
jgi:uncharacterized delta-60 repeat protein